MQAYLTFNGNAAEALAFYAQALGGKILYSMTFGDSPMGAETPADYKGKIMHATLEARGHQLMASDAPPEHVQKPQGFSISLTFTDVADAERKFNALADGGTVTMPFSKTFWAKGFGMCVDKFGIPWMVNCPAEGM